MIDPLRILWVVSVVFSLALIVRLVVSDLYSNYVWFFTFLCVEAVRSGILLQLSPASHVYAVVYLVSQPVVWMLYILVVLELYSLVLQNHPGIASLGRWVLMAGLGVSIGLSLLSLLPEVSRAAGPYPILIYYSVVERGLISSLVIFLLVMALFILWYPVSLCRNVVVHSIIFAAYFICSTLAVLVRNLTNLRLTAAVDITLFVITNVCLVTWIFLLNRRGERQMVVVRRRSRPEDEQRLLEQLEALNSTLTKARK